MVSHSGFEDVVYQAGVCSSGSLNGVFSGSLYNKAWFVHEVVAEALERLLFEKFIENVSLFDILIVFFCTSKSFK